KGTDAQGAVNVASAADPNSPAAHLLSARIFADGDRLEDAIQEYERVLKLDPRPFAADLELARLHMMAGGTDKALTYVQQALAIQPRHVEVHNLLARIYLRRGDLAKAKVEVAALQKAFPNAAASYTIGALVHLAEKHPDAARTS